MLLFLVQNIPLLENFPCQEYPPFEDRKIWVSPPWKTRYPGSVYPFAGNRPRAQLCLSSYLNLGLFTLFFLVVFAMCLVVFALCLVVFAMCLVMFTFGLPT